MKANIKDFSLESVIARYMRAMVEEFGLVLAAQLMQIDARRLQLDLERCQERP